MAHLYRNIYSLLLYCFIPFEILRLLLRGRTAPDYRRRWSERFAQTLPEIEPGCLWFHTVSVGETLAALPVIKAMLARYPHKQVLVTTMTPTGSERVKVSLNDSVVHCYAPYDLPGATQRFFEHLKPAALFIMETELWPNMLNRASVMKVPVVLMNARLSEKSAAGYRHFERITHVMLSQIDLIAAQNATDAKRFETLGASPNQLSVTGNIKFDLNVPEQLLAQADVLHAQIGERPIWLAASTHKGEDEIVIEAHKKLLQSEPSALLILVPRHPERFDSVYELCQQSGLASVRRSSQTSEQISSGDSIYLADTMGELLLFCALAQVVFVGGSLVNRGGHNCLEAAAFKKPVLSGSHDFNFAEINRQLRQAQALSYVSGVESLVEQVGLLLANPGRAESMGLAGFKVVQENRGALERLLTILHQQIDRTD